MRLSQAVPVKITLSGADKICGCCQHASRYEITISGEDHALLKQAAHAVLDIHDGIVVSTEIIWRLTTFCREIGANGLGCKLQKCRVSIGSSCSLWQPRQVTTSTPGAR